MNRSDIFKRAHQLRKTYRSFHGKKGGRLMSMSIALRIAYIEAKGYSFLAKIVDSFGVRYEFETDRGYFSEYNLSEFKTYPIVGGLNPRNFTYVPKSQIVIIK